MNANIAKELRILGETENEAGEKFKSIAYFKAAKNIENFEKEIVSGEQAMKDISGVGKSICLKINEIISTNTLSRNRNDSKSERIKSMKFLQSIHGIGPVKAKTLYERFGVTNVEELRKNKRELDSQQTIGLKYYEEFQQSIPRQEMDVIVKILSEFKDEIDSNIIMTVCGSYRREKSESGDIDILLTKKNWSEDKATPKSIRNFVSYLKEQELITDTLAYGDKKYMGVLSLSSDLTNYKPSKFIHRRIDIRFIPYSYYYAGVLYFTGSYHFNILMRRKALEKELTLNEYGLSSLNDKHNYIKNINSEKDIFDIIEMKYVEPKDRI
jgi:DNA polymerase/3'-5' exonuclease PolX